MLHLWLAQWHFDVIHKVIKQHLNEKSVKDDEYRSNVSLWVKLDLHYIRNTCASSYLCGTEMMSRGFSDCSTSILFCTSLCLLETSLMWNKATFSSSWKQIESNNHISVTDKTESVCAGFHTVSHRVGFGRRFSGPLWGKKNQETCISSRATSALVDLSAVLSTGWNVGCFYWYNLYVSQATYHIYISTKCVMSCSHDMVVTSLGEADGQEKAVEPVTTDQNCVLTLSPKPQDIFKELWLWW